MAQLKDTVISGNLRVTDTIYGHNPHHVYYVKGTQTASTNVFTGNLPEVSELYEGLIIDYWLPFAGTSSGATLTLTLKGGVSSGAINMYYGSTTRLTTHLPALYVGQFIYQTVTISGTNYTGWWYLRSYDSGNTTDIVNLYQGSGAYQANSTVYRYQLLFQMDENKLTPLNNNSNTTGTTKTMLTDVEFDPFGYIFYYNSTTTVNANGNMTTTLYYQRNSVDLRYTFNCGQTLTAHKMLYLVLSLQSNGKVKIASATPWTHDLPTTNDGYLYLLLGRTYSTYQFALFKEHPIYYHDGTSLRKFENIDLATASNSGLMSAADKAKLNGMTTIEVGSASAGTTIPADDITAWSTGVLPSASYDNETETLEFTFGTLPSLSYTAKSIPNISVTTKTVYTLT